jgi:tryptophan-rich sensory protein
MGAPGMAFRSSLELALPSHGHWSLASLARTRLSQSVDHLSLFLVQLGANALWTWLFFVWHLGALAFGEILILWLLILCTVIAFWRVRPLAGALLFPYLGWVTFASALTYSVWKRNPSLLA